MKKLYLEIKLLIKNYFFIILFLLLIFFIIRNFIEIYGPMKNNFRDFYLNNQNESVYKMYFNDLKYILYPTTLIYQFEVVWLYIIIFGFILASYIIGQELRFKTVKVKSAYDDFQKLCYFKVLSVIIVTVVILIISLVIINIINFLWIKKYSGLYPDIFFSPYLELPAFSDFFLPIIKIYGIYIIGVCAIIVYSYSITLFFENYIIMLLLLYINYRYLPEKIFNLYSILIQFFTIPYIWIYKENRIGFYELSIFVENNDRLRFVTIIWVVVVLILFIIITKYKRISD